MRDLNRKAFLKTKEKTLEHVRELKRQSFVRKNENNPDHIKELTKMHKKERDFRVHNYIQMTLSYYSQLRKSKIVL